MSRSYDDSGPLGQGEDGPAFCSIDCTPEEWVAYKAYFEALEANSGNPVELMRIVALGPFGLANAVEGAFRDDRDAVPTAGVDPATLGEPVAF